MEDKVKTNNKLKIIITIITVVSIIVISYILVYFIKETKQTMADTSKLNQIQENNDEIIQNVMNIEDLENIENKTEEELKELNKKEIEKNKTENKTTATKTKNKYYIKVNYGAQVVNIYTYDKNGDYTVPVKAFACSTGGATPTSGVYKIPAKIEWCLMFGDVYGHYCTQIIGNILFHSVPYLEKNNHSLEYWEYDKLGTRASLGCIRLTTIDAKWIFDNVSYGTQVEFYSDSNPGPLGKPSTQKISSAPEELRNWDPTDPDTTNPWRTYSPEENNNIENVQQNQENNNTIIDNQNNVIENGETNVENPNDIIENEEETDNTISDENIETNDVINQENTTSNSEEQESIVNNSEENSEKKK